MPAMTLMVQQCYTVWSKYNRQDKNYTPECSKADTINVLGNEMVPVNMLKSELCAGHQLYIQTLIGPKPCALIRSFPVFAAAGAFTNQGRPSTRFSSSIALRYLQ